MYFLFCFLVRNSVFMTSGFVAVLLLLFLYFCLCRHDGLIMWKLPSILKASCGFTERELENREKQVFVSLSLGRSDHFFTHSEQ